MRYYNNNIQEKVKGERLKVKGLTWVFCVSMIFIFQFSIFNSLSAQVTIGGSVYGGGNKAAGTVTGTTKVEVKAGTVTENVYGGGNQAVVTGSTRVTIDSVGTVSEDVYGGGNNASVNGTTVVTLDGGTVNKNVFGGGNNAGVIGTGTAAVTVNGGTVGANEAAETYGVYGGCNNQGSVSGAVTVNINGGTLGTSTKHLKGIFGGGYGPATTTGGNVTVTIGDMAGNKVPTLYSDIYGGSALGSVNNTSSTTTVNILSGILHGNTFGGGLGEAGVANVAKGRVNGNVIVNIGATDGGETPTYSGFATINGNVYGCNNTNGSPQGNVDVNIYKTSHTDKDLASYQESDATYAIANVFGGGHQAHYNPLNTDNRTKVTIYSCDNTVGRVFGGGDAADAYGVAVKIWGGRFNQVFGGGNGEAIAANIGTGGTNTQVHGGYINQLFGGSNQSGIIGGPIRTQVDHQSECPEKIFEFFGGSNMAPINDNVITTLACGDAIFESVYGGSNMADITGDVTLNIQGGTITNVFGGSKGVSGQNTAIIEGKVNVNLTGGTVDYVYGGNNAGGYVTGVITVTVDSTQENCALTIAHNVYGGGNVAPAYASDRTLLSPVVNIKHGTVGGDVFGAGHGQGARVLSNPIVYMGNGDYASIAKKPVVKGNIYGGGEAARVFGNTKVDIQEGTVEGNVFAGSKGNIVEEMAGDGEALTRAIVDGWTTLMMSGGTVEGNLFGGCENALVGHHSSLANISNPEWSLYNSSSTTNKGKYGNSYITLSDGTVGGSIYGGGMGYEANVNAGCLLGNTNVQMAAGLVKGNIYGGGMMGSIGTYNTDATCVNGTGASTVVVSGGTVGVEMAGQELTLPGNVYGGGLGIASGTNHAGLGNVNSTSVSISGDAYVINSVYGGGDNGHVMADAAVNVTGGTIGKPLTLDERKTDAYVQLTRIRTGNVYGGGNGATSTGVGKDDENNDVPLFLESAGRVYGNTSVTVSGGTVRHNVYGGGNLASVGVFTYNTAGVASYTKGGISSVTINGNALIGPTKDELTKDVNGDDLAASIIDTNFKYLGCNEGSVFGSSRGLAGGALKHLSFTDSTIVTISGNAQVVGNVFGGGENGHVQKGTNVLVSGGTIGGVPLHSGTTTEGYIVPAGSGEYSGVTMHLTDAENEIYEDKYSVGARVQRGNVFGGGKGIDTISWKSQFNYSSTAGRVYGNTKTTISDNAKIYNRVYGGGAIASVGTFTYVKDANNVDTREINGVVSGTGSSTVIVNGGTIGTNGLNNGDVFGGGKGLAGGANSKQKGGTQMVNEAYVGNSYVTVNGGTIASSVYGGSANGHVQGDAYVTITNGTIGTEGLGGWHGNVYGGGGGTNRYLTNENKLYHSITSGRVYGNSYVEISGGTIRHNVYGGGAVASIGTYDIHYDQGTVDLVDGTGTATVTITGGTIGTDGHENGMVFGSGRGEVDYSFFDSMAYAANTIVTIGTRNATTGPKVNGSVYGSGENGHVYQKATINIHSGTIGCTAAEYAAATSAPNTSEQIANFTNNIFPFRGNVYGAGCGTDLTPEGKYNPLAGIVQGNTEVNITGGYISRNIYGAGAMASVGSIESTKKHTNTDSSFALSWPMELSYASGTGNVDVNIYGGHIGTVGAPEGTSGDVYGSARGEAGDRYVFATLANANTTHVTIDFTPSANNVIVGSVYGSGENGHVYDSTIVTLEKGLIGGSLFGGGKGTDKYTDQLKNPSTDALYDAEVYDITAGKVYGNTRVVMNGGRVAKNVYGGGNLASVGKGNYKKYGEGTHVSAADSLLAENSGHCSVHILGGTIGPDTLTYGTAYSGSYNILDGYVFGAGKGIVFPAAAKVGFDYDRNYYVAYVNKTSVIIGDSNNRSCDYHILYPHVTAIVFGGGENGHVRYDTYVQTNRGQIGVRPLANVTSDVGHWVNRGNIFGAGKGEDKLADGSYCQSAGSVTRNTTIDILGARIYRNVQGGGSMASVGPIKGRTGDSSICIINLNLPSEGDTLGGTSQTNNAFGGYIGGGSRGIPSPDGTDNSALATCHNSQINIYRGRVKNTLYGGGENGQMLGNTEINVYDGYIRAAIYGGGKGSWKASADEAGMPGDYTNDTLSGYITGNTTVNLLGGTVPYTYGGCRRASVGGNTTINIGKKNADGSYSGDVKFINEIINDKPNVKNKVYGGNQYAGTPKGDITVNVYSTAHGEDPAHNKYPAGVTDSASLVRNDSIQTYAIGAVYGGSYNSNYLPRPGHSATVHVYGCENTIQELYGGGAAADVGDSNVNANTNLIIDGGRFQKVFGGGDGTIDRYLGQQIPANIYGTATTQIHSGLITEFFGGSNQMGNVKVISTQIDHDTTSCAEVIGNLYSGSNESEIYGDGELIIACGAGKFNEVYGGSNNAQIHGNVKLTIRGGTIGTVFGGSKGRLDNPATPDTNESFAANIDGNVTLNLEGGTIGEAFGGSNVNGAIHGIITVNVLDTCQDCPLKVENVYGAGNITPYTPDSVVVNGVKQTPASPLVNIKHTATPTTFTGSVYGGGFGTGAIVTANPVVTVGDTSQVHTALVGSNVFGGGSFAEVRGNTTVLIQNPNTRVSGAIYGGGALADVRSTNVTLNSGIVGGNIYGGGLGRNAENLVPAIAAKVNGDVQVTVNGGKAANIYGANNINGAPTGIVKVDIYGTDLPDSGYALGNIFGGGNHAVYDSTPVVTIHNCNNKIEYVYGGGNAASVKGTNVIVYGGDTIGNVYGGCYGADVTQYGTQVNVYGGTLGSVFGGNNASGSITGDIRVNVNKQAEPGDGNSACEMHITRVYGGGNHADSKAGIITIACTGGETEGIDTLFGGANQADIAGKIELDITGGHINNVFGGNNISGNISGPITVNVDWDTTQCSHNYLGNVYGAGNLALYDPTYDTIVSPVVNLINGTVSGNVYGGGLGMGTKVISSAATNKGRVASNPVVNIGATSAAHANGVVLVKGNVFGGGALAKVAGNTQVNMLKGTVDGSLFGAGEGCDSNMILALVMKNSTVNMIDGRVKGSVYGGGNLSSVGYYIYDSTNSKALPDSCRVGTGHSAVFISGGIVGPDTLKMPTFKGHIFGGGKGMVADPVANPYITSLGYSGTTEVVVSGDAFIKGSVYGGSESGHVFDSTYVKIQGGQIGSGFNYANNTNYGPYTKWDTASLAECHHWPFETSNLAYDPYADTYDSKGGALNATDGHTYYGNVFGGGSGVFPYQPVNSTHTGVLDTAVWSRTAGAVYGNTRVEVTGGHILTSLYGGNEMTDVGTYNASNTCIKGGTASVIMTGGTLGVPRTLAEIAAHPVTCYLFGAGKGDPRIFFNTRTNIDSAYIRVGAVKGQVAPRIYGSVFGGGEDGHVLRHVSLNIDSGAYIGTEGLSYVDGNIFGAGRGFSGEALTAGTVGGNVEVNITGGTMLGNVYGGGRLASVGTLFTNANDPNYGKMQEGDDHGYVTVNISGGTVIGTEAVFGTTRPSHLNTGNVYGGSMGRLTLIDGSTNPIWPDLAKVKNTEINISDSAVIRATVFGGGELGTVTGNTQINITSDKVKIGTVKQNYSFGSVFGGGYGTYVTDPINTNNKRVPSNHIAGRVYGNTEVNIDEGFVANSVFGGGKMAYVGDSLVANSGNTTVNIGNATQTSNSVVIGGSIFGANDETGSPLGNTNVHIYHTGHTVTPVFKVGNDTILRGNSYPTVRGLAEPFDVYDYADVALIISNNLAGDFVDTGRFALKAVYGGGNYATHTPVADNGTTLVHVHNCESNTIYQVFGGGNAAGTKNNSVIVDGGHIHHLFGGGNGQERAADATGIATTRVHGGLIDTVFGGSNFNGTCAADLRIDHTSPCEELIASIFGGGNYSPGHGGSLTIDCGTGYASVVYGGSNMASNVGNIELNINGGTFDSVFAGSRGSESIASDIDGDVTLNLHGGTIVNAFGGSNYNGNITGVITVNVEDTSSNCALALHNLYGASNLATYHPTDTTITSPVVNIRHIPNSITGNVFGAGHGMESNFVNGVCQHDNVHRGKSFSNPRVNIGDNVATHIAWIKGNVYGGGELAEVEGSTTVTMQNANSHVDSNLFGAGKGYVGDSIAANVAINTTVNIYDGKVNGNVYGGGELASVGTFKPVPGVGYTIDENTGLATVNIMGGHIGADDLDHATSATANGNVYGAGLGRAGVDTTSYGTFRFTYYNYVRNTDVTIGGNAIVRGSVFGGAEDGHVWRNTEVYVKGGEIGTELTATETEENADGIGRDIYTGNVYGGGRGIDESDLVHHTHSMTAGRVFGNSYVEVTGGVIHRDVFGGGSLASVGDTIHEITANGPTDIMGNIINGSFTFDTSLDGVADSTRVYRVGDPVTGTGLAEVVIAGGRIGHTGHNEGSVFGSGRGLAGDASHSEYYHMAYVHNTKVTIKADTIKKVNSTVDSLYIEPDIRGSVFGGGANGHVTQNAYVKMSAGVIGGKTASDYTSEELATMTVDTTINGVGYYPGNYYMDTLTDHWGRIPDGHHTFLGNVYAGGRGVDHSATTHFLSRYAGRVFGNATVEISGGLIYHSVYGGGSMASVGHYAGGASMDSMTCDPGTGKAVVKVSGGRIGTNGRNNGRVFGASRGMSGNRYNYLSFVNTTDVTVSGNAVVRGCVFGGGEDGHVLDSTLVKIQGGTIGSGKRTDLPWGNEYLGNVYGGGRGVDLDTNHRPSNTAGWVRNATHVIVSGGHIHHNVYGGGSLASVGNDGAVGYKNTTGREGRAWVEVTGGRIGIYAAPVKNSDGSYSPNPNSLYGSVFGAGRGRPGVGIAYGNDWTRYTYVSNTNVVINYDTIDNNNYITGNVFGGGNNGHVNNSTSVTVHSGRIGSDGNKGFGSLEGNVFGGGRGEERYEAYRRNASGKYCDANGTAVTFNDVIASKDTLIYLYSKTLNASQENYKTLGIAVDSLVSVTAGLVYGNTNVSINGDSAAAVRILHHVYGGGANASVGNYYIADADYAAAHKLLEGEIYLLTPGTGTATVNITGGTLGTAGLNNGMVFGACRGDIGAPGSVYDSIAYVNESHITIGTLGKDTVFSNPLIHGSVYGGGENGHTVGDSYVTIHSGSIGHHADMYERAKVLDDLSNPTAAQTAELNRILDSLAYCGNVYGGGCGTDKYIDTADGNKAKYNPYAGTVYGNSYINMDGGYVERNIYGGGAMAGLGRCDSTLVYHNNPDSNFALSWPVDIDCRPGKGVATINITGGARVGYSGKDNGDIFGASRGEAGDRYEMTRLANVSYTHVIINIDSSATGYYNTNPKDDHRTPLVAGSVYGGAENGHVLNNTDVQMKSGIVGHALYGGGKGKGTYQTQLHKIGTPITSPADSTATIYSLTAGRVYRNTHITMTGGKVIRNIYGGGNMASVGKGNYGGGPGDYREAGYGERWTSESLALRDTLANSGHTYVTITGGTVGILDPQKPKNSLKDDLPLGNVFGGCRGESAPNVSPSLSPRYAYAPAFFSGYVNHTHVTIGTENSTEGPRLYGSVYGGGQDGHVRGETSVIINSGEIGVPYGDTAAARALVGITDLDNIHWVARGNVYGAGSGIGKYTQNNVESYGTSSGSVTDSTKVCIKGGTIHRNVYGGGSLASIGPLVLPGNPDPDTSYTKTVVIVSGGQIGEADDFEQGYGGSVYGASRGMSEVAPNDYATVWWSRVNVENQADIAGNVYGGGEIGHVKRDTRVNLLGGHVGGSLYGAGRGLSGNEYKDYCNVDSTFVTLAGGQVDVDVYGGAQDGHVKGNTLVTIIGGTVGVGNTSQLDGNVFGGGRGSGKELIEDGDTNFTICVTCGRVGGNTTVNMTNGHLHGSIFGGGRLALTGIDDTGAYVDAQHGNAVITVSGTADTIKATDGITDSVVYSTVIGTDNIDSLLRCDWSVGDIFGSGKGDIDYYSDVLAGRVTNATITINGEPIVRGGVFGGGEMASIGWWGDGGNFYDGTGAATVTINGGTIGSAKEFTYDMPIHDTLSQRVGNENPGEWTIYNEDGTILHTCTGNVFGGSQGDVDTECPHWVSMGRSRTGSVVINGGTILSCVFGGAEQGIVTENTAVTINGGHIGTVVNPGTVNEYYFGDVYAAGYGCDDPDEWDDNTPNDSTAGSAGMGIGWNPGLLAGRTFGNASVDVLDGTIYGSVYGGGSFASVGDDKPGYTVNGNTLVNIGSPTEGNATIYGDVFGANNYRGTPYGNTEVNIYHTAHDSTNSYPLIGSLKAFVAPATQLTGEDLAAQTQAGAQGYALRAVYGGGNKASHEPIDTVDGTTRVRVYYCDENTVHTVYGGGNAANTRNNNVIVDGGRIYRVFGGGNGYSETGNHDNPDAPHYNPGADVLGTASTHVNAGLIDQVYGGSNQMGNIAHVDLSVTHDSADCEEVINESFGGGNEAPGGGGEVVIKCGTYLENFYAGANAARLGSADNPVKLKVDIQGGNIGNFFGGCKGTEDVPANIYGDVTVNYHGGRIVNLFGGSDVNGNITGTITVNVDVYPDFCKCADGLQLDRIYGGGRDAAYTPTDPFRGSPTVNIMNNRYRTGDDRADHQYTAADSSWLDISAVFGGGLGATAVCTSYPRVVIGGFGDTTCVEDGQTIPYRRFARIHGNVYGGGEAAPVVGNTLVIIRNATIGEDTNDVTLNSGMVYGGGLGATAKITGETFVGIYGQSDIKNNVYGGGNAGIVTGSTELQLAYQQQVFPPEFIAFLDADDGNKIKGKFACTTPDVRFSYTRDGSEPPVPATAATLWDGVPFEFGWADTIQCVAYLWDTVHNKVDSSMIPSLIAFDKSTQPIIKIDNNNVTFDGTMGARVRYTLDGTEPTHTHGTVWGVVSENPGTTFTISETQVVKAFVEMRGCFNSSVTSLTATTPTVVIEGTTCTITAPEGHTLTYTTDLSTPVANMAGATRHGTYVNSNTVTFTIPSGNDLTVKAVAQKPGYMPSLIGAAVYRP